MLVDNKVAWVDSEKIEDFALAWRRIEGNLNAATFDIVAFLYDILPGLLVKKALEIIPCDDLGADTPAYVKFIKEKQYGYQVVQLHIEKWVLENAKLHDEEARLIIAHEIGHIILHDASAQKFSTGSGKNVRFLADEESGEWQAKRFADAFFVPLHVAASFGSAHELSAYCKVDLTVAKRRMLAVRAKAIEIGRTSGNSCPQCGDYGTVVFGRSNFCMGCRAHFMH